MSKLLVVDHHPQNVQLLETLLRSNGYEVVTALNGSEAMAKARSDPPDLVITDFLQPVMDGFTLCRRWKADGRLRHIPLIFYTGTETDPKDERLALELGADRFVVKPREPEDLLAILREVEARHQSGRVTAPLPAQPGAIDTSQIPDETPPRKLETRIAELQEATTAMLRELAERTRAEEVLACREKEYRSLVEHLPGVVARFDRHFRFLYVSSSIEAATGIPADRYTGRTLTEAGMSADKVALWEKGIRQVFETACEGHLEYEFAGPSGRRHGEARLVPERNPKGEVESVLSFNHDITERRQLEVQSRQSDKLEAVGRLAGGVAHDFNNILTIIQGHATLLLESGTLAPDTTRSLRAISSAAERAAQFTRQLLTFSRRQVTQKRQLDLNKLVSEITATLTRIVGEGVALRTHLSPQLPPIVADQSMIEQTLMNLVANSRDAVPEGGEVTITTNAISVDETAARQKVDARPGSFVQLTVSDNGCGISPQNLPRIFEPFFTTKDVGKGTGLGLATVHGIVKQHEGWIEVDSEVGRGTTVHILLPAAAPEAVDERPPAANTEVRGAGECILVVEDEAAVRTLVAGVLTQLGYSVLQADTGASALKLWNQHRDRIQLLLTDLVMPEGINGRELADQLREENPKLKVIFTSGYSAEVAGADFAINEGGNFLQKPYAPTRLAQTVRHCLNG